MTKVNFTNWLHSELDAVFNREQTPEQMMLKAIPMIHELSSQNNGKPLVSGRSELLLAFAEWIAKDTITGLLGTPEYYVEKFLIIATNKKVVENQK